MRLPQGLRAATPKGPVIDDYFSTTLYSGNASTQAITNGIDTTANSAVWIKARNDTSTYGFFTPIMGTGIYRETINNSVRQIDADTLTAFDATGFTLGADAKFNGSGDNFVSWTFARVEKFFDIVPFTSTAGGGATISHNLGVTPGCVIATTYSSGDHWFVTHRSLSANQYMRLNTTDAVLTFTGMGVGDASSITYPSGLFGNSISGFAMFFAHEAGGFGPGGADSASSCGTYNGNGSATGPTVTTGFEPQWLMIRRTTTSGFRWIIYDNKRDTANVRDKYLRNIINDTEQTGLGVDFNATGFQIKSNGTDVNANGVKYIYVAIAKGA